MVSAYRLHASAALLGLVLLASCAADCRDPDWRSRGYADGFGGHPPQDLRLARDCGRRGISVSESEYLAGWRDGYDEWYRMVGSIGLD